MRLLLDLQHEIIQVMEAIEASFDHHNLVIDTLQSGVVNRMVAMSDQAMGVVIERLYVNH